ncbi:hypothetical protein KSS87_010109 [Heliosperma pusillum]|nr:hypothetical protein KSS87_010109 [Heliosperma pusillum]
MLNIKELPAAKTIGDDEGVKNQKQTCERSERLWPEEAGAVVIKARSAQGTKFGEERSVAVIWTDGDQLTMSTPKGLMVVANRLPFTAVRNGPDSWLLQSNSARGLVTTLQGTSIAFETV